MGNSAVYAVKIAVIASLTVAFFTAISGLLVNLASFTLGNTGFAEIIGLVGLYLPINPAVFMSTIGIGMSAVITFLVARKIYTLMMNAQKSA